MNTNKNKLFQNLDDVLSSINNKQLINDFVRLGKVLLDEIDVKVGHTAIDQLTARRRLINSVSLNHDCVPSSRWYLLNENAVNELPKKLFEALVNELPPKILKLAVNNLNQKQKGVNVKNVDTLNASLGSRIPKSIFDKIQKQIK